MKILVATDGSSHAERALRLLESLPGRTAMELTVIHVAPLTDIPIPVYGHTPAVKRQLRKLHEIEWAASLERGNAAAARLRDAGLEARAIVRTGDPADRIIRSAKDLSVDLVVMGSRGRSNVTGFLLGSVSRKVAEGAPCPVLIVRPKKGTGAAPQSSFRRVLIGVDGSKGAERACRFLAEFPLSLGSVVTAVHVRGKSLESRGITGFRSIWVAREREAAARLLKDTKGLLSKPGRIVRTRSDQGHPSEALVREARRESADLIVVGSRGLTGVKRWMLGSVANKVLAHAPCSVLIVRPSAR